MTLPRLKDSGSQREALTKRELAAIRQPCLLIHGDKNQIHPIQHAFNMVADLVNAKDGAKMYTIKGIFGLDCMARMIKPLLSRWSRIHQRRTNDCLCLQPSVSPIPFAITGSAIGAATPKRPSRRIYFPCAGIIGGSSGRFIYCRAGSTFTHVIFAYIGCGAAITGGELHGRGQGDPESVLAIGVRWPANAQVGLRCFFGQRLKINCTRCRYSERKHDHWFQGDRSWMSYVGKKISVPDLSKGY